MLRKVSEQDAKQIAEPIMQALLQMLNLGGKSASGVQEDALMAIGTLVEGMQIETKTINTIAQSLQCFMPYCCHLIKFLIIFFDNF